MITSPLTFGNTPVPYTVCWTAEEKCHLEHCPHANRIAICNHVAPGEGKPMFGTPHMQRQRQTIAMELCDLCGKPLKGRTKVSLSHARERTGAEGLCIMQFEPMVHKECGAICLQHCPSLKRDVRNGSLFVRQITRFRVQFALLSSEASVMACGIAHRGAVGHAKVELLRWKPRDERWLTA